MTDYGQFYDKDGYLPTSDSAKKAKKEKCSTNSVKEVIKYAKKLNVLRKEASDLGICLDELEDVAKELK